MTIVHAVRWDGGLDGDIVVELRVDGQGPIDARRFDRPGDLVALLMESSVVSDELLAGAGCYGVCIASRGITQKEFIRPIVDKTVKFMASIDPSSLVLYRQLERMRKLAVESELEGLELRKQLLDEAHAVMGTANRGEEASRPD